MRRAGRRSSQCAGSVQQRTATNTDVADQSSAGTNGAILVSQPGSQRITPEWNRGGAQNTLPWSEAIDQSFQQPAGAISSPPQLARFEERARQQQLATGDSFGQVSEVDPLDVNRPAILSWSTSGPSLSQTIPVHSTNIGGWQQPFATPLPPVDGLNEAIRPINAIVNAQSHGQLPVPPLIPAPFQQQANIPAQLQQQQQPISPITTTNVGQQLPPVGSGQQPSQANGANVLPNIVAQTPEQQQLLAQLRQSFASGQRLTHEQAIEAYRQFGSQIPPDQLQKLAALALGG